MSTIDKAVEEYAQALADGDPLRTLHHRHSGLPLIVKDAGDDLLKDDEVMVIGALKKTLQWQALERVEAWAALEALKKWAGLFIKLTPENREQAVDDEEKGFAAVCDKKLRELGRIH